MSVTVVANSLSVDRSGPSWLVESSGYDILAELCGKSRDQAATEKCRADLAIGIPRSARSLEQMVVIKRFHAEPAEADWLQLVGELEFATMLQHPNVVRTLGIGLEGGRYFSITDYLEGATLQACLSWSASTRTRLGTAVVARILLGILDAAKHASLVAKSGVSLALARCPVAVDDVFINYDGQVKLLGFKGTHGGAQRAASAVDVLLEQQLTPELRRVLPCLIRSVDDTARDPARQIRQALSEGRAELASVMSHVLKKERAQRALLFARSFTQLRGPVRRVSALTGKEEAPPASGFRRIGTAGPSESFGLTLPFGLVRPERRS